MGRKKKRGLEEPKRIFCWYCDRDFPDEGVLVTHQKNKHFKCMFCHKRLLSLSGLVIHCQQLHKETVEKVPNAIDGRDSLEVSVYGMDGVPEQEEDKQKEANDAAAAAQQHPGYGQHPYPYRTIVAGGGAAPPPSSAPPAPHMGAGGLPQPSPPGHPRQPRGPPPPAGPYMPSQPPMGHHHPGSQQQPPQHYHGYYPPPSYPPPPQGPPHGPPYHPSGPGQPWHGPHQPPAHFYPPHPPPNAYGGAQPYPPVHFQPHGPYGPWPPHPSYGGAPGPGGGPPQGAPMMGPGQGGEVVPSPYGAPAPVEQQLPPQPHPQQQPQQQQQQQQQPHQQQSHQPQPQQQQQHHQQQQQMYRPPGGLPERRGETPWGQPTPGHTVTNPMNAGTQHPSSMRPSGGAPPSLQEPKDRPISADAQKPLHGTDGQVDNVAKPVPPPQSLPASQPATTPPPPQSNAMAQAPFEASKSTNANSTNPSTLTVANLNLVFPYADVSMEEMRAAQPQYAIDTK